MTFVGHGSPLGGLAAWSRKLIVTRHRDFKRLIRRRMGKTGESYTAARAHLLGGTPGPVTPIAQHPGEAGMYPFEKFTERAKKVLTLAQEEAERSQHSYIGTEHLLVGLLREKDGIAAIVLTRLGIEIEVVRATIASVLGRNERIIIQQIIPTSRVKKVIEISFEEARKMGHNYVGTEHLLLGLLVEGEGIAAHVLQDLGATLERVRAEIDRALAEGVQEPGGGQPAGRAGAIRPTGVLNDYLAAAQRAARAEGAEGPRADHLLSALLAQGTPVPAVPELLRAAGADLDVLRRRLRPPRRVKNLQSRLQTLVQEKDDAIARQDYEAAAQARNEEKRLREEFSQAIAAWQSSWGRSK